MNFQTVWIKHYPSKGSFHNAESNNMMLVQWILHLLSMHLQLYTVLGLNITRLTSLLISTDADLSLQHEPQTINIL